MVVDAMYAIIGELSLKDAMRWVRGSNLVRLPRRKSLKVELHDVEALCYILKIFAPTEWLISLSIGNQLTAAGSSCYAASKRIVTQRAVS
jgi:hypothetical protein